MTHGLLKPVAILIQEKKVVRGKGFLEKVVDKLNNVQQMHRQTGWKY